MVTTDQRLKSAGIEIHLSLKPDFSLHFLLETPELKPFVFLSYMENLVIICNNTLIDTKNRNLHLSESDFYFRFYPPVFLNLYSLHTFLLIRQKVWYRN